MKNFIRDKIKQIQRKRKHIGEGKNGVKAFDLLAGIGCVVAGALSVVATPLVGIGTIAIGAACLYNYKTIKDKEKSERDALNVEEKHLNSVLNGQTTITNTDAQNKLRKDNLKDLGDDLKETTEDLAKTDDLKSKVGIGLGLSFIPLFAWAGPVTLALTGGFAISKFLLDRQSKNQKKDVDKIQLQMDVINDDLGIAGKMPQPQAQQTQGQGQQQQNGRSRGNTRTRQQTQGQAQQTQQTQGQGQQQTQQTQGQGQQQTQQTQGQAQQQTQQTQGQAQQQTHQRRSGQQQPVVTQVPPRNNTPVQPANVNAVNGYVNGLGGVDELEMLRRTYTIILNNLATSANNALAKLYNDYLASAGRMTASEYYTRVAAIQKQYEDKSNAIKTEYEQKKQEIIKKMSNQYRIN